ncbi:MAG: polyprenyl diphosphate synthase, partial [Armatimonadota bacterium]
RLEGHRQGYKTLKSIVIAAAELDVKALTAYTFSSENWRRPKSEVSGLMRLIRFAARAELEEMKKEGVRIVVSGRMHELPVSVQNQLNEDIRATAHNSRITLNIAVNYGGRCEIVDAARYAAEMVRRNEIEPDDIDEQLISGLMYHPELPDPDLLIRTAGEMRISNFLLWQCAYTELYVTQTLWPDFTKDDLVKAIADYQKRTRKFGAVVES